MCHLLHHRASARTYFRQSQPHHRQESEPIRTRSLNDNRANRAESSACYRCLRSGMVWPWGALCCRKARRVQGVRVRGWNRSSCRCEAFSDWVCGPPFFFVGIDSFRFFPRQSSGNARQKPWRVEALLPSLRGALAIQNTEWRPSWESIVCSAATAPAQLMIPGV